MTETTEPTLEQDEQTVKEESWQKCEKQLRVVMGLLNSLHDGLIGDGTFTYGGGGENDKHSVQLLYLYRSFNSVRCSYELVQLGYYTQAISLLRSALEDLLVCQRCKKDSALVKRLLEGQEERFNFAAMAKAEGGKFADWWQKSYHDLSLFVHPTPLGLRILLSPEDRRVRLGPYFDQQELIGVIYYHLVILIRVLGLLAPILDSMNAYPGWGQPTLERIKGANRLIEEIVEELDPEGRLAMKEALSAPEEKSGSWEEYKQQRAARVRDQKG